MDTTFHLIEHHIGRSVGRLVLRKLLSAIAAVRGETGIVAARVNLQDIAITIDAVSLSSKEHAVFLHSRYDYIWIGCSWKQPRKVQGFDRNHVALLVRPRCA